MANLSKQGKGGNTAAMVVAIMVLFSSLMIVVAGASEPKVTEIVKISDTAYLDIDTDCEYVFEDLILGDEYGVYVNTENNQELKSFYFVLFEDKDGELCYASFEVGSNPELARKCEEYIKDDTMLIGDMLLDGLCSAQLISELSSDMQGFYRTAYTNTSLKLPGKNSGIHFVYDAATEEEFLENQKNDTTTMTIVGGVMMALCVLALVLLVRKRKKIDAANAEIDKRLAEMAANPSEDPMSLN